MVFHFFELSVDNVVRFFSRISWLGRCVCRAERDATQQANIDANPDHEFYSLNIDSGGMWVRRILDRMLAAEQAGEDPVTAAELTGMASQ